MSEKREIKKFGYNFNPDQKRIELSKKSSELFEKIEELMNDLPGSREKSIALTKLEESSMWLSKHIFQLKEVE